MTKGKKHMDGTKRCRIQFGLEAGEPARTIAKEIGVSLSTVSREIGKHTYESFKGCYGRTNQCARRADCGLAGVCGDCPARGAPCARCSYRNCNRVCGRVEYPDCPKRLLRTAQVCNGCPEMKGCHRRKLVYVAGRAHEDYRRVLSEHRQGAALEEWERRHVDELVSPRVKAGQSVHHVCVTNAARLTRNEHTIQRHVNYGILVPNKCAANVVAVFDRLCDELGPELFQRLFPALLTDRGTEFSYPSRVEACEDGTKRTRVFFCDPTDSNQKSQLERNHELVREILPKGVPFDGLTQAQASLALSHVNAYVRHAQGDRTPFEAFEFLYGEGTAAKLHIERIDPRDVVLKPRLVGIEMK